MATSRLVGEHEKLLYATRYEEKADKFEPNPIEDETILDQGRTEVGLPSMAEYRNVIENVRAQKK
jgi:hypothetical protein